MNSFKFKHATLTREESERSIHRVNEIFRSIEDEIMSAAKLGHQRTIVTLPPDTTKRFELNIMVELQAAGYKIDQMAGSSASFKVDWSE